MFTDNYRVKKTVELAVKRFEVLRENIDYAPNGRPYEEVEKNIIAEERLIEDIATLMKGMTLKEVISTWYTVLNELRCQTEICWLSPIDAIYSAIDALFPTEQGLDSFSHCEYLDLDCENLNDEIKKFDKKIEKRTYTGFLSEQFDGLLLLICYYNKAVIYRETEERYKHEVEFYSYIKRRAEAYGLNISQLGVLDE